MLLTLGSISIFAQTKTVTGKIVSEEDGKPMSGVTISVKGKKW
jgi:hypothetical protein